MCCVTLLVARRGVARNYTTRERKFSFSKIANPTHLPAPNASGVTRALRLVLYTQPRKSASDARAGHWTPRSAATRHF